MRPQRRFNFLCSLASTVMAQLIPSVPIPPPYPGICHLVVGAGGGDLSENLCPGVGRLSVLLEAVNVAPFSIFH